MKREAIRWAWMVAAVPLALMLSVGAGLYLVPRWSNVVAPFECVVLLAASVVTGRWVLFAVPAGWRRGSYRFLRAEVIAATVFASLDVLVTAALVALLWLVIRSLREHPIMF